MILPLACTHTQCNHRDDNCLFSAMHIDTFCSPLFWNNDTPSKKLEDRGFHPEPLVEMEVCPGAPCLILLMLSNYRSSMWGGGNGLPICNAAGTHASRSPKSAPRRQQVMCLPRVLLLGGCDIGAACARNRNCAHWPCLACVLYSKELPGPVSYGDQVTSSFLFPSSTSLLTVQLWRSGSQGIRRSTMVIPDLIVGYANN